LKGEVVSGLVFLAPTSSPGGDSPWFSAERWFSASANLHIEAGLGGFGSSSGLKGEEFRGRLPRTNLVAGDDFAAGSGEA
jgi:hypothetical protein